MGKTWMNEFGITLSIDAQGHEHRGKGEDGGQFTRNSSGDASDQTNQGTESREPVLKTIDRSQHLTPDSKRRHKEAFNRVTQALPNIARESISKNIKSIEFYNSGGELLRGMLADDPDNAEVKAMVEAGIDVGGCYTPASGKLRIDGAKAMPKLGGGSVVGLHHVHAHELGHAIDGPEEEYSSSRQWKEAYKEELTNGNLNEYAAKNGEHEGFAEFCRLVYVGGVDREKIQQMFPKCSKFFKREGLWQ